MDLAVSEIPARGIDQQIRQGGSLLLHVGRRLLYRASDNRWSPLTIFVPVDPSSFPQTTHSRGYGNGCVRGGYKDLSPICFPNTPWPRAPNKAASFHGGSSLFPVCGRVLGDNDMAGWQLRYRYRSSIRCAKKKLMDLGGRWKKFKNAHHNLLKNKFAGVCIRWLNKTCMHCTPGTDENRYMVVAGSRYSAN